ncbi:uncharacterized protein [Rutidosis leptorrhynchoides]|uniref:uncharacterized protein isoform X2 n=1 Tax=Rutidosis leptorrhynchoides TaxID=125765 RepID=UPI003A997722
MSSSSSREYSPDWLRTTQAPPTISILTLSSSSESPPHNVTSEDERDDQLPISSVIKKKTSQLTSPSILQQTTKRTRPEGNKGGDWEGAKGKSPENPSNPQEPKNLDWTLPYDSGYELSDHEMGQHPNEYRKDDGVLDTSEVSSLKGGASKLDSPPKKRPKVEDMVTTVTKGKNVTKKENDGDLRMLEGETSVKHEPYISSSRLPLVLSDKVQYSKALVECEGESIDLSGDLGSVGRVVISDSPSGDQNMFLDLKGTIYKTSIIPSRTFCVVSFGQSEAKIEAIMNDFIQLKPQSNVYEAETMVEGTLEGFSFDSEDEADKHIIHRTDENEDAELLQANGKGRGKSEKTSEAPKKKGKTTVKKPAKKVKRKGPIAKKTKTKK